MTNSWEKKNKVFFLGFIMTDNSEIDMSKELYDSIELMIELDLRETSMLVQSVIQRGLNCLPTKKNTLKQNSDVSTCDIFCPFLFSTLGSNRLCGEIFMILCEMNIQSLFEYFFFYFILSVTSMNLYFKNLVDKCF